MARHQSECGGQQVGPVLISLQSSDDKLESIFECLQTMKISNDCRLDRVEQGMRSLQKQTSVTHEQLKILLYKSVDIEARSHH